MFHKLFLIVAVTLAIAFSADVRSQSFVEKDVQVYRAKGIVFGERAVSVLAFFLPEFLT
jgi:protein-S-isoprenylcysteine O-methyltransferase Ste14